MIFFKHCYYSNPHEWGVLGLPDHSTGLGDFDAYKPGMPVVLAQDMAGQEEYAGHIFAVCTLLHIVGRTKRYGNPRVITKENIAQWPECLVIHELAFVNPVSYREFGNGGLAREAQSHGRLFQISCGDEVKAWLRHQKLEPITNVYHSSEAKEAIAMLSQYHTTPFSNW